MNRRKFILDTSLVASIVAMIPGFSWAALKSSASWIRKSIDRQALVKRHNVVLTNTGKFHLEMHWWHAAHFPPVGKQAPGFPDGDKWVVKWVGLNAAP